jgi:hypothetical protein
LIINCDIDQKAHNNRINIRHDHLTKRGHDPTLRKYERIGMTKKQMENAQAIASHPEEVAEVIKEAEKNEDIPTKTALLSKIAH